MENDMTNTTEKTRLQRWEEIERKHLGRCIDQVWGAGRRVLIEKMELKDHRSTVIVIKRFEKAVSKSSSQPFPELEGVDVFVPLPARKFTWEETDEELAAYRSRLTSVAG
jgi:hypothetical protein